MAPVEAPGCALVSYPGAPGTAANAIRGATSSAAEQAPARRTEQPGRAGDVRRERRLHLGTPRARVVVPLAAEAAVDLQDAVVVGEHVSGDGACERVLRISVQVDLDHAGGDRGTQRQRVTS